MHPERAFDFNVVPLEGHDVGMAWRGADPIC